MARKSGFPIGIVLMLVFLLTACSGGGNPVTGSLTGDEGLSSHRDVNVSNHRMLWGYYNCVIDTATNTVQVVPTRGAMMHVNAVEWMQPPAGSLANLQVVITDDSLWLTEGRFDVDVSLTHPFAGLTQYTGFDVMGVFITDGHKQMLSQLGVRYTDEGNQDAWLRNPDGYTRWWNQDEFPFDGITIFSYIPGAVGFDADGLDATINPYKYFTVGIGPEDDANEWVRSNIPDRGMFPSGETITRSYELQWPMVAGFPQLAFDYAVVASWEPATIVPPVTIPDDFPINANALEPVAISVTDTSNLYYDDVNDIYGGMLVFDIEVYDWQGLDPATSIDALMDRVVIELPDSPVFPGGTYYAETDASWNVAAGAAHSSTWHVEVPGLTPADIGDTPMWIILETDLDYDNGFATEYPIGAPLASYFKTTAHIFGAEGQPACDNLTSEFIDRNYIEVEDYSVEVTVPGGSGYSCDWSIVPYGNPKVWQTFPPQDQPVEDITVNWYAVTGQGATIGSYEVCVSVYNAEGYDMCCLSVTVDDLPALGPVTGQNGITLPWQPDQGAQPCDITVYNTGSGSNGQIMYQDPMLVPPKVRLYRFNDNYTAIVGTPTLDTTGYPIPLDEVSTWNDHHKFDVAPTGSVIFASSASALWPSIVDPNSYNINDPYHAWIMPYWNLTGTSIMLGLFGDVGYNPTPPSPPDPDSVPWKHVVDWTSGAAYYTNRIYSLMTISELWIPEHPGYTHPGDIYAIYAASPYSDITTDYDPIGLDLSTQHPSGGVVDDTVPNLMAVAVDDEMPVSADWSSGPGDLSSDIVVWYFLSSEATGADRKVHLVLLPEDITIAFDIYYYDDYIGTGGTWGVDFGGAIPIDVETIYANSVGSSLSHTYNWLAVLVDTGTGWRVDVFRYDPLFGTIVPVDSFDAGAGAGDPTGLDVDNEQHELHVLFDNAGTYQVTVLEFT